MRSRESDLQHPHPRPPGVHHVDHHVSGVGLHGCSGERAQHTVRLTRFGRSARENGRERRLDAPDLVVGQVADGDELEVRLVTRDAVEAEEAGSSIRGGELL